MNNLQFAMAWRVCASFAVLLFMTNWPVDLLAEVSVHTSDGRQLIGEVDDRTDDQRLWIRHEEDRIVLTAAVAWSSITAAAIDGEKVPLGEFAERSMPLATKGPEAFLAWHDEREVADFAVNPAGWRDYVPAHMAAPFPARIASIEIDAVLVNRDRDVEPDGVELCVAAFNCVAVPVAVKGNISARLWGERVGVNDSHERFEDLQRWSESVAQCDFRDGVACYYLPLRTVRPEFDFSLAPQAQLNVRLSVHGEGNFEASAPVHLHQFNPLRDRLQLYQGRRFYRDELTEEVWHD